MAGFSSVTGQESIVYADNASFDGTQRGGRMTTNGQLWIGSTASPHVRLSTLTPGAGISITNGSGSITIASAGGGFVWQEINTATSALASNGYIATATCTLTLPLTPSMGTSVGVMVLTTGALTVKAQNTDTIRMASTVSAAGGTAISQTNGSISGASASFVYDAISGVWFAFAGYSGTWNVT